MDWSVHARPRCPQLAGACAPGPTQLSLSLVKGAFLKRQRYLRLAEVSSRALIGQDRAVLSERIGQAQICCDASVIIYPREIDESPVCPSS